MTYRFRRQSMIHALDIETSPATRGDGNAVEPVMAERRGGMPQGVRFHSGVSEAPSAAALATFIKPNLG